MKLKEFIEVTSIYDGKKALIRATCIDAIVDNAAEVESFAEGCNCIVKPACRTIRYSGVKIDVIENIDEISNMIYQAEL